MPRTLEQILPEVEKPARYLGGEHNSVVKDPKGVRVRACLAFPDVYEIGMSHLGLRILYSVLNRRDDMALERCFTPWPDMEKALRKHALPLTSLESRTPLGAFDVVGFSLQYELCFTNVLLMLDLAGIPFRTRDRGEGAPMILGGGPVAFSPEPVADFFDAFLIGDGEEAFPKLLEAYADMKEAGRSRGEMLKAFARLPGVYVPSLYATAEDPHCGLDYVTGPDPAALAAGEAPPPFPVRRAVLDDLNKYPFPSDTIVPHAEIVHDRVSIEIARGCTEGCRFCQAGIIYRPVRERTAESILESALDSLEETGYDEVSLTSLSPADYSCLPDLVEKVMDRMVDSRVGVSVSSLRPYGLTEQLAKQISRVKKSGFTIAPEAGTQRMRDVLNKGITEEHILQAAHNAFGEGWDLIKTYFMIGLPTETDEDLLAMIEIAEKIFRIGRDRLSKAKGGPGVTPRLHFSASSHVPKPHAPFQWAAMEPIEALYAKQRYISTRVRNRNIKFKKHHVETSHLEAVMSRGDRRLSKVIEIAYAKGCRFDGWTEHFRWNEWCAAFEEAGVPMQKYLDAIPLEATLPWDHIDTTVLKEFLVREWKRALKSMVSPACEKPFKKFNRPFRPDDKLVCYDCGCACDLPHITEERVTNRDNLLHISSRPGLRKPLAPAANDAPAFRYRATFAKRGGARFTSHLDLVRTFSRAFRRAGLGLKYSQGFNPKPLLAFTPALALGVEGAREAVDFQLGAPAEGPALVKRLNDVLPEGVVIESVALVLPGAPSLAGDVRSADYRVSVPLVVEPALLTPGRGSGSVETMPFNEESGLRDDAEAAGDGGSDDAADDGGAFGAAPGAARGGEASWHVARVEEFNAASSRVIEKRRKGKLVKVDLRKFTGAVSWSDASESGRIDLAFSVAFLEGGATVRPEEILIGIYGLLPAGCHIVREDLRYASTPPRPGGEPKAAAAAVSLV